MLRKTLAIFALFAACFAAEVAHAGPPNGRFAAEEIKERIRGMRIARIVAALNLDERTAARLAPILNRAYDEIAQIAADSGQARRELRTLVYAQPADETRINQLVDRMLANRQRIEAIE